MDAVISQSSNNQISPVDALWAIIQNQSKAVRKALAKRLLEEEISKTARQQAMISASMNRALDELHSGQAKHNARTLFSK